MKRGSSKGQSISESSNRSIEYRARKAEIQDFIKRQVEEKGALKTKESDFRAKIEIILLKFLLELNLFESLVQSFKFRLKLSSFDVSKLTYSRNRLIQS